MSSTMALTVALVLLLANAFFVGAEFALVSARRSQIEPRAESGSRGARTTLRAMEQVSLMMAGAQLGITVCSLGLGAVGEPAVAHLIEPGLDALGVPHGLVHPIAFAIALVIVVCLHVVLGEMVPKNIAIAGPDRSALVLGPPMYAVVRVLRPIIVTINAMANGILRLMRIQPKDEVSSSFTRQEVAALVEESHGEGLIAEDEYDRLSGALTFTEKTVATVTIAPEDLATLQRAATLREAEDLCAATGYSRFPILDHGKLIGYVHIKDVLEDDPRHRSRPVAERGIRPFASVRVDAPLHEVLEVLQRRGAHLARVVDDEGATVGVAALEDVIEELVGEIRDAAHSADT